MAQLVFWTKDVERSGDPYIDAGRYTRGDVIEVVTDEHQLTKAELEHPDWMVVSAPGAVDDFAILLDSESEQQFGRMARLRSHYLDVDAINGGASVREATRAKAPFPDPNVIAP